MRWKFQTLDSSQSYTFDMNPNQMDSPLLEKTVDSHAQGIDGVIRGARKDVAKGWSFSGVLHSQAQYEAFELWLHKGRIHLTDHLGRTFLVRLTNFDPTRAGTRQHAWRHTYVVSVTTYGGPL